MKKILIILLPVLVICIVVSSCKGGDEISRATTENEAQRLNTGEVYVDEASDAGFGYKYCYLSKEMSGDVGIADKNGSILLSPGYVSVVPVAENRFIARKFIESSPHCALVDENGKEIISFFEGEIRQINNSDSGEKAILSIEPLNKARTFTDTDGEKITDEEFSYVGKLSETLFYGEKDEKRFVFDNSGKLAFVLAENETADLKNFDGYTLVVKNCGSSFKYGLKNSEKKLIIPCEYDEIIFAGNGKIIARIGPLDGIEPSDIVKLYDGEGKILIDGGIFNSIWFAEGKEVGTGKKCNTDENKSAFSCWVIDINGKKLSDEYESLKCNDDGTFTAKNGDKVFILDSSGKEI